LQDICGASHKANDILVQTGNPMTHCGTIISPAERSSAIRIVAKIIDVSGRKPR
jgi:hypothetical protein